MENMKIKIFADGANFDDMLTIYHEDYIKGFTTNPSLMKKAGVNNYEFFAKKVLAHIQDVPVSFEVFADEFDLMEQEARKIGGWGKNVYIKIPITNSRGESSIPLIKKLSAQGFQLNVTAILTVKQVQETVAAFALHSRNIVSVFAGRIADTGRDPIPYMKQAAVLCHAKAGVELLWASSRELLNIFQAEECGCDIITVINDILKKLPKVGLDLEKLSLNTVQMFHEDARMLKYSIL
jgi:transaldolase